MPHVPTLAPVAPQGDNIGTPKAKNPSKGPKEPQASISLTAALKALAEGSFKEAALKADEPEPEEPMPRIEARPLMSPKIPKTITGPEPS
jgi:hypothetical protein